MNQSVRMGAVGASITVWIAITPFKFGDAVSFDCAKASNTSEYLVCSTPALSDLDDRLAAAYSAARRQTGNPGQLLMDQRAWLARRNLCRTSDCVFQAYQTRLADLGGKTVRSEAPANSNGGMEVELLSRYGILTVPVLINNAITLDFVVDSGASDVSVPADVVSTLIRTGTINDDDFLGKRTYTLADGSTVPSETFRIRSLKVGSTILEDVAASIAPARGQLLLGQSFLARFRSWSIDNRRKVLILQ